MRAACDATIETIQTGMPVARIELLDALQVQGVQRLFEARPARDADAVPRVPRLATESVAEQSRRFGEIADEHGGGPFAWATKPEERTKLWQARHDALLGALGLRPGARGFATDVCVPISRLADCVEETQPTSPRTASIAPIVGHVGDGNFHVTPLVDMNDPGGDRAGRSASAQRLARRAIAMDGTCTGEHGVGQKKIPYLEEEHGAGRARPDAAHQGVARSAEPVQSGRISRVKRDCVIASGA